VPRWWGQLLLQERRQGRQENQCVRLKDTPKVKNKAVAAPVHAGDLQPDLPLQ